MAQGDIAITVIGNLTADPELRFTPAGKPVANFTVASTPRVFDRNTNQWKDGDALYMRCNVWNEPAENAAESLTRGSRVVVTGRLKQRSYETREGEKRTVIELEVDEVALSLKFAPAKSKSTSSGTLPGGTRPGDTGPANHRQLAGTGARGGDDPWNTPARPQDDEPPF